MIWWPPYPTEFLSDDRDDGTMPENVDELRNAVVGHRIVRCGYETVRGKWGKSEREAFVITLDNGKKVSLAPNSDCCAYTELEDFLLDPNSVDHIITGVGTTDEYTIWHIYADFGDIMRLMVGWSGGNIGYYGYGFDIQVIDSEEEKAA